MSEADTVFHEAAPGILVRTLTGLESGVCAGSEFGGCSHTTFSVCITFAKPISAAELRQSLRRVLVRLRHLAPSIACKLSKQSSDKYQFSYAVPKTLDDALAWVNGILFFERGGGGFTASHEHVVRERWWKASEGKYTHQYYITPIGATTDVSFSWAFSLSAHHSNIDGRSAWMMFDKLLSFLTEDLKGGAPPVEGLDWGKETYRLPPTPAQIWSIETTGKAESLPPAEPLAPPPEHLVPWLHHPLSYESIEGGDFVCRIGLTTEDTARMHVVCKEHGKTVTQVVTALLCLGNAEAVLRNAANTSPHAFKEVADGFATATHLPTGLTSMNVRKHLPVSYQTLESEHSTPLYAADAFPLAPFDIEPYRRMLQVDTEKFEVSRSVDKAAFWDGMTQSVADSWKAVEGTYESFRRNTSRFGVVTEKESDSREGTVPLFTSFGDMTRLGLLESVRPPKGNGTLVVDDIDFTTRSTLPNPHFSFFQYDGRFVVKIAHGKTFSSEKDMQLRARVIREWISVLFD